MKVDTNLFNILLDNKIEKGDEMGCNYNTFIPVNYF